MSPCHANHVLKRAAPSSPAPPSGMHSPHYRYPLHQCSIMGGDAAGGPPLNEFVSHPVSWNGMRGRSMSAFRAHCGGEPQSSDDVVHHRPLELRPVSSTPP